MKIADSKIQFATDHTQKQTSSMKVSLKSQTVPSSTSDQDHINLSTSSLDSLLSQRATTTGDQQISTATDIKMLILIKLLEAMTGKKINLADFASAIGGNPSQNSTTGDSTQNTPGTTQQVELNYSEASQETEQTQFDATGTVKTADGKTININLDLKMSREFAQQTSLNVAQTQSAPTRLKDPLVINFDGNSTELTPRKFSFDIDTDGKQDQISFVKPNSGFLALDKNNDGKINDGSELFGATSGNGFSDLAQYDTDKNGWIDENDPIYQKLKIWTKDDNGQDHLYTLKEKDIGAIYLGNAETPFQLKDQSTHDTEGVVSSSGLFLHENGQAGTVQQIDLTT